jgi:hypothetical protein
LPRLQFAAVLGGPVASFMWCPVLLFDVALVLWVIIKGAAPPSGRRPG